MTPSFGSQQTYYTEARPWHHSLDSLSFLADQGLSSVVPATQARLQSILDAALAGINASASTTAVTTGTIIFIAILPAIANIRKKS